MSSLTTSDFIASLSSTQVSSLLLQINQLEALLSDNLENYSSIQQADKDSAEKGYSGFISSSGFISNLNLDQSLFLSQIMRQIITGSIMSHKPERDDYTDSNFIAALGYDEAVYLFNFLTKIYRKLAYDKDLFPRNHGLEEFISSLNQEQRAFLLCFIGRLQLHVRFNLSNESQNYPKWSYSGRHVEIEGVRYEISAKPGTGWCPFSCVTGNCEYVGSFAPETAEGWGMLGSGFRELRARGHEYAAIEALTYFTDLRRYQFTGYSCTARVANLDKSKYEQV